MYTPYADTPDLDEWTDQAAAWQRLSQVEERVQPAPPRELTALQQLILAYIAAEPGRMSSQIAGTLGMQQSSVYWSLVSLRDRHLLRAEKTANNGHVRYWPA